MAFSTTQMVIVLIVFFLGFSIFKTWKLKDQIYCTFIRQDRTEDNKFASIKSNRIDWQNRWYNLDAKRTTLKLMWQGVIPTWVRCLKYKWDSNMPLDPTSWNNTYDNPADRKALNRSEAIQSLMAKQNTLLGAKAGKKSFLESLMPILMIGGFLILGYLVWKQQSSIDLLGNGQNYMEGQLDQLIKSAGK